MLNSHGSAAIKDAIAAGATTLSLPLTSSLLSFITCHDGPSCNQGRCPVCCSLADQRRRNRPVAPEIYEQTWKRQAFALRSYTREVGDIAPVPFEKIQIDIDAAIKAYMKSFDQQDGPKAANCACIADIGLVWDMSASQERRTVVVVEFVVTGGDGCADFELLETLQDRFDPNWGYPQPWNSPALVSPIDLGATQDHGIWPSEGLLFGYTKRRLDKASRPLIMSKKKQLASMAANYGECSIEHRTLIRGLGISEKGLCFDRDELALLSIF